METINRAFWCITQLAQKAPLCHTCRSIQGKKGGLCQLWAVCLEEPEDWFEHIDIKAAWDYGFFLKTKTLRSSKLCTCSPREKHALFPEGNAPEVIHTPPLLPDQLVRWDGQEKRQTHFWREWVGGSSPAHRSICSHRAGYVEAAERQGTGSFSPLTARCEPSHYNTQPWRGAARNNKAVWDGRRGVEGISITEPLHYRTAFKQNFISTSSHNTLAHTHWRTACISASL